MRRRGFPLPSGPCTSWHGGPPLEHNKLLLRRSDYCTHIMALTSRASLRAVTALRHSCRALSASSTRCQYPATQDNPVPVNTNKTTPKTPTVSETNALPTGTTAGKDEALIEDPVVGEQRRLQQAPNRLTRWSRSQRPRSEAMVGPRFEQMNVEYQPRPYAAIDLIHKQPVHWTEKRQVSCDGGGGPLGHPRIFINVDKPQICMCTYCGLPFVRSMPTPKSRAYH